MMVPGLIGELERIVLVKKIKKETKLSLVGRNPFIGLQPFYLKIQKN